MEGAKEVIVMLQNARCQVDLRRLRCFLLGCALLSQSVVARLFPNLIKMIKIWAGEIMDILSQGIHLCGIQNSGRPLFEEQAMRKMSQQPFHIDRRCSALTYVYQEPPEHLLPDYKTIWGCRYKDQIQCSQGQKQLSIVPQVRPECIRAELGIVNVNKGYGGWISAVDKLRESIREVTDRGFPVRTKEPCR